MQCGTNWVIEAVFTDPVTLDYNHAVLQIFDREKWDILINQL